MQGGIPITLIHRGVHVYRNRIWLAGGHARPKLWPEVRRKSSKTNQLFVYGTCSMESTHTCNHLWFSTVRTLDLPWISPQKLKSTSCIKQKHMQKTCRPVWLSRPIKRSETIGNTILEYEVPRIRQLQWRLFLQVYAENLVDWYASWRPTFWEQSGNTVLEY